MGAVSGKQPSESQMGSTVAKAGLLNFTKALAAEVARHNILVNAVNPGRCMNDRWRSRAEALARKEGTCVEAAIR